MILAIVSGLVVLWGLLSAVGGVFVGPTVDDKFSNFIRGSFAIAFAGVWPAFVGYDVRGEEELTVMLVVGDWLRGCLHLQSESFAWLKDATGFA